MLKTKRDTVLCWPLSHVLHSPNSFNPQSYFFEEDTIIATCHNTLKDKEGNSCTQPYTEQVGVTESPYLTFSKCNSQYDYTQNRMLTLGKPEIFPWHKLPGQTEDLT